MRLVFLFKVVEGLVTAINPDELLKQQKHKRHIKPKTAYSVYKSASIVENYSVYNDRGFIIEQCKTDFSYKHHLVEQSRNSGRA